MRGNIPGDLLPASAVRNGRHNAMAHATGYLPNPGTEGVEMGVGVVMVVHVVPETQGGVVGVGGDADELVGCVDSRLIGLVWQDAQEQRGGAGVALVLRCSGGSKSRGPAVQPVLEAAVGHQIALARPWPR